MKVKSKPDFDKEKILKQKIIKAASAIKKKYNTLKMILNQNDKNLHTFYKPILEPLKNISQDIKSSKMQTPLSNTVASKQKEDEEEKLEGEDVTQDFDESATLDPTDVNESFVNSYLEGNLAGDPKVFDQGPRAPNYNAVDNKLYLGNAEMEILSNGDIQIHNEIFEGTKGLYELIFKKTPKDYTNEDKTL